MWQGDTSELSKSKRMMSGLELRGNLMFKSSKRPQPTYLGDFSAQAYGSLTPDKKHECSLFLEYLRVFACCENIIA